MTHAIENYLEAISPDNVCGDNLEEEAEFIALETALEGKPERQIGDTLVEAEPPNWRKVQQQTESLLKQTLDLRILIARLRSQIALEGFAGLNTGLALLTAVVEQRWDSVHPQLDPDDHNDPTQRLNILSALCHHDTVLLPLQQIPLLESKSLGCFNFRHITLANGKANPTQKEHPPEQATIDAAIEECEIDFLHDRFQSVSATLVHLEKLDQLILSYVSASQAPSFAKLANFLTECKTFLAACLKRKNTEILPSEIAPPSDNLEDRPPEEVTSAQKIPHPAKFQRGEIHNHDDVITTLNQVCHYYRTAEPSSPVPLLIERAIRLVGKSFIDVIKDIAPSGMDEAQIIFGKQQHSDN